LQSHSQVASSTGSRKSITQSDYCDERRPSPLPQTWRSRGMTTTADFLAISKVEAGGVTTPHVPCCMPHCSQFGMLWPHPRHAPGIAHVPLLAPRRARLVLLRRRGAPPDLTLGRGALASAAACGMCLPFSSPAAESHLGGPRGGSLHAMNFLDRAHLESEILGPRLTAIW